MATSASELISRVAKLEGRADSAEKIDDLFLKVHDELILPGAQTIKATVETQRETAVLLKELRDTQIVCQATRNTEEKARVECREKNKNIGVWVSISSIILTGIGCAAVWVWDHLHIE